MAQQILLFGRPLRHRPTVHLEDRVVTETTGTTRPLDDLAASLATEDARRVARRTRWIDERHATDEARAALRARQAPQRVEQLLVVLSVGCIWTGEATREDAGRAVQRVDFETGVVGERPESALLGVETRLLHGVLFERRAVLGSLLADSNLAQGDEPQRKSGEEPLQLDELVLRSCRNEQRAHRAGGRSLSVRCRAWRAGMR
jgi:hypothetical protein